MTTVFPVIGMCMLVLAAVILLIAELNDSNDAGQIQMAFIGLVLAFGFLGLLLK